ncbi:hypothetical protein [Cupriavidus metallidurans]|jgi:hypothetical protein|uniref:hypothetical protein n=1 Tax=Cupriavidus metallidurans TaxID=119219 RepID=UPI000CE02C24|nr:hypothetical protein [Cupriavidus metallidurans]AVA38230.1 hypothetical protein C3Z06_32000 [Cupriavidus metallidurans]
MSAHIRQLAAVVLVFPLVLAVAGCEENPFGKRSHEAVNVAQVPAAVKTTIDQQAHGRSVGEIEKKTANGKTRYEVTLGSGSEKQTLLISEDGKQVTPSEDEDEDD